MKINSAGFGRRLRFSALMVRMLVRLILLSMSAMLALVPGMQGERQNQAIASHHHGQTNRNQADQKLVISANLVNVTVAVADTHGRFISGLTKDHFEVFDNKIKQQIAHFSGEDVPISLGIVCDLSRSMKDRMKQSLRALKRFIETSHPYDDIFLITFNDRAVLAEDFTTSAGRILDHLMFATPTGSTALYDAVYLALEKVSRGRYSKKAILIISDGEDNKSRYTGTELRERAKESDALIYAIGLTDDFSKDSGAAEYGRFVLTEITQTTGGQAFFLKAYNEELLVRICATIALELRRQYSIGFYPTDLTRDGKRHKLEIKIKPPKGVGRLYITYKNGYQFPKQ